LTDKHPERHIDRRPEAERALVLHPVRPNDNDLRNPEARLAEAVGLAEALDLQIEGAEIAPLRQVTPATLFGKGKVEELRILAEARGVHVAVIDEALSPVQQRNLEKAWGCKVVDRTGLILEIFARRARTREGKLQVDLARLEYERSRLVRTWTHLERQRGGTGSTGGPGERQLELDRRQIADRIVKLKKELEEVRRTRTLHRTARKKVPHPTVALVGYTNAGKSTLFNRLTEAQVLAEDMLFATLDPTLRTVKLPGGRPAILSDTVGFISDLPHELVEAFRATLEEVQEADVILHVRDMSNPDAEAQGRDVQQVLDQLQATSDHGRTVLEVWNKLDLVAEDAREALLARARLSGHGGGLRSPPPPRRRVGRSWRGLASDAVGRGGRGRRRLALPARPGPRAHGWGGRRGPVDRPPASAGLGPVRARFSDGPHRTCDRDCRNGG
jgi:GTPase